jgi:hypothetical protein
MTASPEAEMSQPDIEDRPDLNTGTKWSEMDLLDLGNCVRLNQPVEEIASFMCRSRREIRDKIADFGGIERTCPTSRKARQRGETSRTNRSLTKRLLALPEFRGLPQRMTHQPEQRGAGDHQHRCDHPAYRDRVGRRLIVELRQQAHGDGPLAVPLALASLEGIPIAAAHWTARAPKRTPRRSTTSRCGGAAARRSR